MFERDDMEYLETVFDGRYVRKKDCDKTVEKADEHMNRIDVVTAKIVTKLNLIATILGGIGAAFLAVVVKVLFGT